MPSACSFWYSLVPSIRGTPCAHCSGHMCLVILILYVWGAAKTVHMGHNKIFAITTWSYCSVFSGQFVLYLKVLAILVPEISTILSCEKFYHKKTLQLRKTTLKFGYRFSHSEMRSLILHRSQTL